LKAPGTPDKVATIQGVGTVDTGTGGNLRTDGLGTATPFAGKITGAGGIIKVGPGVLDLTGASDYTRITRVDGGTLRIAGSTATSNSAQVNSGGTLGGTGTAGGPLTAFSGGHVAPGDSPGVLKIGAGSFKAGSSLDAEITDSTAGKFDQLDVT